MNLLAAEERKVALGNCPGAKGTARMSGAGGGGTLTWQVTAPLDDEPPHGQAGEDEEDEEDQGKGDGENWKQTKRRR